jgi:hypothetical protein
MRRLLTALDRAIPAVHEVEAARDALLAAVAGPAIRLAEPPGEGRNTEAGDHHES